MKAILLSDLPRNLSHVYKQNILSEFGKYLDIPDKLFVREDISSAPENFKDVDFILSTWGMPHFSEEEIKKYFPALKCVFYAAGTVRTFATEFLKCGIRVFSAWKANAVPVAEYTVSQIVLANKGFFRTFKATDPEDYSIKKDDRKNISGNYNSTVGLISYGAIGSLVASKLKAFKLNTLVYSWELTKDRVIADGFTLASLYELFEKSDVVSNHLANTPETVGMLNYECFKRMKPYATFINTGRGAQVIEEDLIRILTERPDLTAVLDVTDPEPPISGSPLYTLKNCIITPHIAGSQGNEAGRMAEYMLDDLLRYLNGEKCIYEVNEELLKTMA